MKIKILISSVLLMMSATIYANNELSMVSHHRQPKEAFVLFYMSRCVHCRRFDPILKQYAMSHHIPVLAYTLDGKSLPSFPNSLHPNPSEMHTFFPDGKPVVPTLFLMDLSRHSIMPVLKGEAKAYQLAMRMRKIQSQVQH